MKKNIFPIPLLIFFVCVCACSFSFAQSNLQFSRVVVEKIAGAVPSATTITKDVTVPAGKVWKIESASINYNDGSYLYRSDDYGLVYFSVGDFALGASQGTNGAGFNKFPIWLPEGTYTMQLRNQGVSNTELRGVISAIEFIVAP